eukprot:106731-Pyramimonas_sp.AAC.1
MLWGEPIGWGQRTEEEEARLALLVRKPCERFFPHKLFLQRLRVPRLGVTVTFVSLLPQHWLHFCHSSLDIGYISVTPPTLNSSFRDSEYLGIV